MKILRIAVRLLGTIMIVLGLLFWSGNAYELLPVHMLLGLLLVLLLWTVAILAARTGEQPARVGLALLWGIVVPVFGMTQAQVLPGDLHWLIRVLHLLVGLFAIGLVEMLTTRALKRTPVLRHSQATA
jgi:hypothetical protein